MSKNKTKVTLDIAILTAGRVDLFRRCVEAVLPQLTPEYKIQVHNNGHPSAEYEEVYKLLPEGSSIIRSNQMSGFSEGANKVINRGNAPLVLFVTDDVFIHPGTIETLLRRMDDQSIGICGYKLLFPEDSQEAVRPAGKVQHVGMASNIRGDMIHPMIGWSPDNPKCNLSREVLAVTGASFIVRRNVFSQVRGFDPIYGKGYYEDMDLCFKIRGAGKRVFVDTVATATHGVGQTFSKLSEPIPYYQNQQIFKLRWTNAMPWSEWEMW